MTLLLESVRSVDPAARLLAPGELHARCTPDAFVATATAFGRGARLADLFATVDGEGTDLRAVFAEPGEATWVVLEATLPEDRFDSLTPSLHAASWYEREIREMYGVEPVGHPAPDALRLLGWPSSVRPMRDQLPDTIPPAPISARHGIVRGQGVLQIPLGPVRSGPQEAAEFLFSSGGEDLVAVAPQLGYKFRAVERLAEGRDAEDAVLLAERLAGTSTFANALAFVQACERAQGWEPTRRARWARSLLSELERLHAHFGTLGRVAEACGQAVAAAQYGVLKEEVLRVCAELTGHRYLRGSLSLGGIQADLPDARLHRLRADAPGWGRRSAAIAELLDATATFVDRLEGTAVLTPPYAGQHHLVGPIARASGADRDARRDHPYAAYDRVRVSVPTDERGDAAARVTVLRAEVQEAVRTALALLEESPAGPIAARQQAVAGAALGWAEAPGGETLQYVELDTKGAVRRWRARPPGVVNWHPFAHACASGNNLTDFPVLEASFGLSVAEFDR